MFWFYIYNYNIVLKKLTLQIYAKILIFLVCLQIRFFLNKSID